MAGIFSGGPVAAAPAAPAPVPTGDAPAIELKCILVGDGATGKTTFVKKHLTGEFEKQYLPTVGADVVRLDFSTNYGKIRFNVWDTAGQEKLGCLRDGYYIGGNACIIFFDVTNRETYKHVTNWYRDVVRVCDKIPMCLVGNKVDIVDRQVRPRQITFHRKKNIQYYDLSARANYNIERPWLYLMRRLSGSQDLNIVAALAVTPPTASISAEKIKELQDAQKQADDLAASGGLDDAEDLD
eukprot:TRINITY_DN60287_c0_g1_i1.p2 TRINITY_DN60287_c0_g1~~TRINITY_DN60287_c0_g1_i1.p2  ORF type:complete len:277 (+),score=54.68 TRINITY_DN60287_c0_g1_i1:113-832(+)